MNESPLIANERTRKIEKARGYKDFTMDIEDVFSQENIKTTIDNYFASQGGEEEEEGGVITQETKQHFGGIAILASDTSQVIPFVSIGFPSIIQVSSAPRLIFWADRAVILEDYNNSSLTVRPSAVGVANTPFNVGVEIVGYADAMPEYIYEPFIVGRNLREDKSFYVSFWNEEKVILKGISGGIAGYPITCGLHILGKLNEDDSDYQTWYVEVELESDSQEYLYKNMNIGKVDSKIHRVTIDLDSESEKHYFGAMGITANIKDARISGLTPLKAREGFISECTDTYLVLNSFAFGEANPPLRYALEIRGG